MSMSDPLADLITRINNGQMAGKTDIKLPGSKAKAAVCSVLKDEGYIEDFAVTDEAGKSQLSVTLKYYKGQPVIEQFRRVSRPGRRVYCSKEELPSVMGGLGVAIISTSKGLMSDQDARDAGHGGEVLCVVS